MLVKLLKHTPEPEKTCAIAARVCYSSATIDELNTKLDKAKIKNLLNKVIASGHYSVLEHASFTFGIEGVSRALLAQLTRHRVASFSVQSQRYVKVKDTLDYIIPPEIKKNKELFLEYKSEIENIKKIYDKMILKGILAEDARYILPNAATTKIVLTMNARELHHFFKLRCCNRAQWEIRAMACQMLSQTKKIAPLLFEGSGPSCVNGICDESEFCGKPWSKLKIPRN